MASLLPWTWTEQRPAPGTAEDVNTAPMLFRPITFSTKRSIDASCHQTESDTDEDHNQQTSNQSINESVNQSNNQSKSQSSVPPVTAKNRIAVSPMCMYSARDGMVSDWHVAHYGEIAIGGGKLTV
jgi:hypothetical protein